MSDVSRRALRIVALLCLFVGVGLGVWARISLPLTFGAQWVPVMSSAFLLGVALVVAAVSVRDS